jgi:hypothetical protein
MRAIRSDPLGPYGRILQRAPLFDPDQGMQKIRRKAPVRPAVKSPGCGPQPIALIDKKETDMAVVLKERAGAGVAAGYGQLLDSLEKIRCAADSTAVLLIDLQRSFTSGAWMRSIGAHASEDVSPIRQAFANCAVFLEKYYQTMAFMFTRCPFPPASYVWDERLDGMIDAAQLYFIKPGNSVLFPPHNGFKEWIGHCLQDGKKTLLMGGCTLNSCVRVSAIETQRLFAPHGLQVVVDLNLSGARLRNYTPASYFDGLSAVASAVRQMLAAGVQVVRRVTFYK